MYFKGVGLKENDFAANPDGKVLFLFFVYVPETCCFHFQKFNWGQFELDFELFRKQRMKNDKKTCFETVLTVTYIVYI